MGGLTIANCIRCGAPKKDVSATCPYCGSQENNRIQPKGNPYTVTGSPSAKKKSKWPWILAGAVVIFVLLLLFSDHSEPESPNQVNTFTTPQNQEVDEPNLEALGGSSQFSDAVDQVLSGNSFGRYSEAYANSGGNYSDANSSQYGEELYEEIYDWDEDDWEIFWEAMYEYLDEEALEYLYSMDEDELLELIGEIMSEEE